MFRGGLVVPSCTGSRVRFHDYRSRIASRCIKREYTDAYQRIGNHSVSRKRQRPRFRFYFSAVRSYRSTALKIQPPTHPALSFGYTLGAQQHILVPSFSIPCHTIPTLCFVFLSPITRTDIPIHIHIPSCNFPLNCQPSVCFSRIHFYSHESTLFHYRHTSLPVLLVTQIIVCL